MKRLAFVLTLSSILLLAQTAHAQGHYCDTPQPTAGSVTVSTAVTLSSCSDGKDVNGNTTTISGVALYDNGVRSTPAFTKGTTSTISGKTVYTINFTAAAVAGVHTYQVGLINSGPGGGEAAKSAPFVLTLLLPPSVPTAATNLTVQ